MSLRNKENKLRGKIKIGSVSISFLLSLFNDGTLAVNRNNYLPGCSHWEIRAFLPTEDGVHIYHVNTMQASPMIRTVESPSDMLTVLQEQGTLHGMLHGYKCMRLECMQSGLVACFF